MTDDQTTMTAPGGLAHDPRRPAEIDAEVFASTTAALTASVSKVIDGKPEAVRSALVCLLAEGHLLIEDVPGVGKTMLARALGSSIEATVRRIQFTPDLLPGDVTGVSVYDPAERRFEFKPGAIFAHIVIADEINRSSPKTQSALLEAMEERQVTVDGTSRRLPDPFLVVATQNPLEMEGTYALPEAQRDRFMMRISMGYPDAANEALMLRQRDSANPLDAVRAVIGSDRVAALIAWARSVHVSPAVEEYAVSLARATRQHPDIRLGASPRATLQLVRAAKVWAALDGREYVLPDDLVTLLEPVFAHRLIAARGTTVSRGRTGADLIAATLESIVASVRVPVATR
ncbi:MoxR family ATPase [Microbacterium sp. EYE_5]|nr:MULTISPECIES: MoxR family ATPase [unclassified Microbacterium]MCK6080318.1 MoxR family ATPase [Microbacterium sp. EYE_382]MCK6085589.1 MoxR family ATPase [Microbacterium sp. EYE_384]MCK6122186.1 MoxR family ATPase [Microbacterium sp. EYE_80]MCK6126352.1 MoxR family ATPase [Microbacterium sp. EYE_79]MCK6141273.1 MoxR family ATPase [Microbacterium sp. EYE_39]